ncbi:carbohydrate ABC transporter permease [Segeticoccus rhizosphaerae]|uniref:carbohydrate ABC transporter permease n=1 Tax=Segeticoccus rhizosphaerae TaxID=1104777 RepID=UPI001EEF8023|nr:sugar ABC transporter permease [Segeticoccus rhizosphaerae]
MGSSAVSTTPPGRRHRRRNGRAALLFLAPAGLVVFGLVAWPIIRTGWLSFHRVISPLPTVPTESVGLRNFSTALTDPALISAAGRTLYFTLVSTAAELTFGIALGVLMAQRLRFRWLLRAAVLLPWALPTVVNAAMWRYMLNADYGPVNALLTQVGLIDGYRSWLGTPLSALHMIIIADVWKNTSIAAFFVLAGLTVIPRDLIEAAEVDGAGTIRRFFAITLPLLRPVIAVVLVLRTIEAFKVFDIVFVMTRGGPADGTQTVALYAYITAFSNQSFGYGSAVALLIVLVVLVLAMIYIRLLTSSSGPEDR